MLSSKKLTKDRLALKRKGYTLEEAAKELGVHYTHLLRVLDGERISKRTLDAARALPNKKKGGKNA